MNKYNRIIWDDDKISSFWDFEINFKKNEDNWFTNLKGDGILNYANKYLKFKNLNILDYGSGKGFLVDKILNKFKSSKVSTSEFSSQGVDVLEAKFNKHNQYQKTVWIQEIPCPELKENSFDIVFLTEVIEHLSDTYYDDTFNEIYRILKPGGKIIVTTPNDENLEKSLTACPNCNSVFHLMQHIRSFNTEFMKNEMSNFKFKPLISEGVNFSHYNKNNLTSILKRLKAKFSNQKQPHLIYIGVK